MGSASIVLEENNHGFITDLARMEGLHGGKYRAQIITRLKDFADWDYGVIHLIRSGFTEFFEASEVVHSH